MHVLILDAQQRSALAAVRSLGRRGIRLHVADARRSTLSGASRYVDSELLYPDPTREPAAFTDWTLETARRLGVQVVLPMTDVTSMLLAPIQQAFGPIKVGCAPHGAYEQLSDKARLLDLAAQAGVRIPATTRLTNIHELDRHLSSCAFPLVLKPARSKVLMDGRVVATSVFIAASAADARQYLLTQEWFGALPCLAQEFIPGTGAGVFTLYADGSALAWFGHRRLREKPPSGGVSVLSESAPVDAVLRESAARLLDAAGWNGPAMVEYRVAHDGTPYLMEVNCRFWGSLQLSIDSGLDFPWLWLQLLTDATRPAAPAYRTGRRLRWLLGDVDNLLIQLRDSSLTASAKLSAVANFAASSCDWRARQEVLRWSDPLPGLRELRQWLGALA